VPPIDPIATALFVAGWALLFAGWIAKTAGRDPLGPEPRGEYPNTVLALFVAGLAWAAGEVALGLTLGDEAREGGVLPVIVFAGFHLVLALALLPAALSGTRRAVLGRGRLLAVGFAGGLVAYAAGTGTGWIVETLYHAAFHHDAPRQSVVEQATSAHGVELLLLSLGAVVLAPIGEEIFFRGVLLPAFARTIGPRTANVLQAILFGLVHLLGAPSTWPILVPLAVVGWICGRLYVRTGSLLVPILAHATFNAANLAIMRSM